MTAAAAIAKDLKSVRRVELRITTQKLEEPVAGYGLVVITDSARAATVARAVIGREVVEVFLVLLLDARGKLIGVHEAARGGVASASIEMADVFRAAIAAGAPRIIIAHNHPSGDPSPSVADVAITNRIREAGKIIGVDVVDHVVVSAERHCSMLETPCAWGDVS